MKRLFLIDAYALIFRYYYAFLGRPMRNREGMNTSVVFGFAKFLRELLRREKPDLLGVAFDPAGGCFRKRLFPEYKANRSATPEDIIASVPYVKRLVEAMCIPILEVADYEADDVIGTLSAKGEAAGYEVFMVTPDKDYGQLVTEHCKLYKQKGDEIEIVDCEAIKAKYGIDDPQLVRDILAIWGDASDNIPGVEGIGEKGACKLVQSWGTVENILANAEQIKGKQGERLRASEEKLRLSKVLTTISLDVPIEFNETALTACEPKVDELRELYREMDFRHFLSELGGETTPEPNTAQQQTQSQTETKKLSDKQIKQAATLEGQGDLFSAFAPTQSNEATTETAPLDLFSTVESFATAATTPHTYILIESAEELREVVAKFMTAREFSFDTETTGLSPVDDEIVGLSLSMQPHEAYYIAIDQGVKAEFTEILRPLFTNQYVAIVGQNIKFDIMVLRKLGIEVEGYLIDTMLLSYLLDPEARHGMTALAERYLNYTPIEIESLIGRGAKQISMDMVDRKSVAEYAAEDADITLRLKEILYKKVKSKGLMQLYNSIEEPMIKILADMEYTGVKIDSEALAAYGDELNTKLIELSDEIRNEAQNPTLNINSSAQLGEVLFGQMKIAAKPKLTKTKRYCTDEEYLQSFAGEHKIVANILEYRGVKKLLSTYVEALPKLVSKTTGRIHTTYNQAVTATGRLSSTNPNLQNIPIRDALGRPIRAAFVPSEPNRKILSADYSQIELRIMAHLANDDALIDAFWAGEDIHTATAARLFGKSLTEVTAEERRRAKTANFGIIYGISAFGLSQRLEIQRSEAKAIIDSYFASYPAVKEYMDRMVMEARLTEYAETLFGRRRYLRDINSRNAVARGVAERNAINAPIQGTAADIMKFAMVGIWREFKYQEIESKIIMQVHDEVVIDLVASEEQRVREIIAQEMETAAELSVQLLAECGVGDSWLAAH